MNILLLNILAQNMNDSVTNEISISGAEIPSFHSYAQVCRVKYVSD